MWSHLIKSFTLLTGTIYTCDSDLVQSQKYNISDSECVVEFLGYKYIFIEFPVLNFLTIEFVRNLKC